MGGFFSEGCQVTQAKPSSKMVLDKEYLISGLRRTITISCLEGHEEENCSHAGGSWAESR